VTGVNVSFLLPWYPPKSGLMRKHTVTHCTVTTGIVKTLYLCLIFGAMYPNKSGPIHKHIAKHTLFEQQPKSDDASLGKFSKQKLECAVQCGNLLPCTGTGGAYVQYLQASSRTLWQILVVKAYEPPPRMKAFKEKTN
jgi:hypothetical protein